MNSRAAMLRGVRAALGRSAGDAVPDPPPVRLTPSAPVDRAALFATRLEALLGVVHRAASEREAGGIAEGILAGRQGVASNSPLLARCGVTALPGVISGVTDRARLQNLCAAAAAGISGAEYGLADTGSLVMLAGPQQARMISLLPPLHIAILEKSKILADIDELFQVLPDPARQTSSMVLITGPSRTGDIEQISIRGVHGPGEIHVILLD